MKRLLFASMLIVVIIATACTNSHKIKREPQLSDTLYTAKAAMEIYDYNPKRALLILDSAEIVGNISRDRASFLRSKVFTMSLEDMHLDSAQKICMSLMHSDYIKNADNHESVLDLLVAITRRKQDFEQWLQWSTEKAEFCRKHHNEVEALRTEAEIGAILTYLGRHDEGLKKLDDVISELDDTRRFSEMDACIIALRRKVDVLKEMDRYEDIIPIAEKIIDKTNDYEQHPTDYHDGSFREPKANNVPDYCDFYRVKAYAYLARAYAETDDIANARKYLSLFEHSRYGQTFDGRMMISTTWCKLGDYDKMLAVYDEAEKYLKGDTINENYAVILYNRAAAAKARGQYNTAYDYIRRHAALTQMINEELLESKANEYAARYTLQEQQMKIDRQSIQNRMLNYLLLTMLIGIMVIIFLYNHSIFQKQKLADKNAALVKLIDARIHVERLTEACRIFREQPDKSVAAVAKDVGITVPNLQKLFREQYGISVAEYRKLHQKLNDNDKEE